MVAQSHAGNLEGQHTICIHSNSSASSNDFVCSKGHVLKDYCAPSDQITCSVCLQPIPKGSVLKGDKLCGLSACLSCACERFRQLSCDRGHQLKNYCSNGDNTSCSTCQQSIPKDAFFKGDKQCALQVCSQCVKNRFSIAYCPCGNQLKEYPVRSGDRITCKVCTKLVPAGSMFKGDRRCGFSACPSCASAHLCGVINVPASGTASKLASSRPASSDLRQQRACDTASGVLLLQRPLPSHGSPAGILGGGGLKMRMCKPVQPPMACWDEGSPPPEDFSPARRKRTASGYGSTDSAVARRFQEEFDQEVAEKEANERFTCKICFCEEKLEDGVNLDCGHITCTECFASYLELKVREKCVSQREMCCPMPKCFCPITEFQVLGFLKSELQARFLDTRAELYRPDAPNERHCRCPCGEAVIVADTRQEEGFVQCPSCKELVCWKCQERHEGSSCAEYWRWRHEHNENDPDQQAFDELMAKEGWKKCPVCKAPTSRSFGCNVMTCESAACRSAGGCSKFCYVCGEQLPGSTYFNNVLHFPDGIFRDFCVNKPRDHDQESDVFFQLWRLVQARLDDVEQTFEKHKRIAKEQFAT
eukprot:TRINITY_DN19788_c0_g1_i1.p1 TRINITY_DN19788_c0_g1~~TRINITY_DN19788_c0_g1_i1.p1  ORF type:complete len:589 (-),score=79.68 TRINITY_DN19788_c0_g1_i1:309-2075(-)